VALAGQIDLSMGRQAREAVLGAMLAG
jgi:hypothetical protein